MQFLMLVLHFGAVATLRFPLRLVGCSWRQKIGDLTWRVPGYPTLVQINVSSFRIVRLRIFTEAPLGGWVYTNDAWQRPAPTPLEEWKAGGGMTRRRRWVRRIYYSTKQS